MGNRVIRRTYNAGHVAVHHCFSPLTGNWVIRRITMKTINSIKKAGFSPLTGNWVIRPNISISMIIAFCLFQSPYGESGNTTYRNRSQPASCAGCFSPLTGNRVIRPALPERRDLVFPGFSPLTGNRVIRRSVTLLCALLDALQVSVPLRGIG